MNTKLAPYLIVLTIVVLGCIGLTSATAAPVPPAVPSHLYTPTSVSGYAPVTALADNPNPPTTPVKLVFVHHSTGGNWLASSSTNDPGGDLGQTLMNNNYFVSATNYGWGPNQIGSSTDIPNWPDWFTGPDRDTIMAALYNENNQNICNPSSPSDDCFGDWPRLATNPGGENQIIMFKSCFPNSDLYSEPSDQLTVEDAQAVYNDILTYFATRQDKLFIVITAPPLQASETASERAANARAFNNWLVNDWLSSNNYTRTNVAVFDYYNVLTSNGSSGRTDDPSVTTEPNDYAMRPDGNHHYWNGSQIVHPQTINNNFSAYPSGDSHPTTAGHQKASAEFVQLLNVFYNRWKGGTPPVTYDHFTYLPVVLNNYASVPSTCLHPLTGVTISGPTTGYANTSYTFTANPAPSNATTPIAYTWSPAPNSGQGTASASYQWNTTGSKSVSVSANNCGGTVNDDHTIAIQAPPSGSLVQPGDLVYLGAFRLPGGEDPPQTFGYGGNAMSFNPDGHITNTDMYSGSLFITGYDRTESYLNGDQVAEVTIPAPVNSRNVADLPYASFIQGFHNVAAGHFTELYTIPKVGMQYLNHTDTGPKIHLTWGRHLQQLDDNLPSQAWFNPDLAHPNLQGEWFIGNQNPNSVNGYMFEIPAAWADAHAQGRYLATGRTNAGGLGGMGPALLAYRPWLTGGAAPASGTHLSETPLLLYESSMITSTITRCMNNYQHADEWEGGAWITTPSGKSAVLFAGTKGTGTKYWYGFIHPTNPMSPCVYTEVIGDFWPCRLADGTECPDTDVVQCCTEGVDCISGRGWWSTRSDAQLVLYNPADLAQVTAGTMQSWEPQPYATIDVDERLYLNPPEEEEFELGWGDQRRNRISAVAYDRKNGYLYVLEVHGDGAKPMVHVWKVQG